MSVGNLPLLSALQLGQAEKTIELLQTQAQIQQSVLQDAAVKELKEQQSQVEKISKPAKKQGRLIDEDADSSKEQGFFSESERRRSGEGQAEKNDASSEREHSALTGSLIDRKI